ncbi:BACON domain-containing protein [Bacteroides reticulotermitis]|uniref:1,4-alpha-glucan branching enzyme n=2 Tax=Bacteroides reticulotermitis TaxID=1133319 RepID=W4UPF8_9BACE|nr:BACON domain-containing carbohydrate-binding protein [Bacteroides reticulotermitis]MBB4044975.1 hypothetical protein [Bacteroides reticulotermitis]GAE82831.1 1,4-alpha-glucan branching enzyme [Bacteroides reticulotermitis JCM 10512]
MNLFILKHKMLVLFAATVMLTACGEDAIEEVGIITLDHELYECSKEGGTVEVKVNSPEDWTLKGYSYWAIPSATEGKNGDVITFTVEENLSLQPLKMEYIFVAGNATKPFTIRQTEGEYVEDAITLSENALTIGPDGGTLEATITSSKGWSVNNSSNSWCRISSTKGQSGDKVTWTVDPSYQSLDRKLTFTFTRGYASVSLTITQSKRASTPNDIVLSMESDNVGEEGGTIILAVESALYDWTMSVGTGTWCHIDDAHGGSKDDKNVQFTYTVDPNTTAYARTNTTTFRAGPTTKTFKITQKACPKSPDDIVLSGETFDMPAEGGTVEVVLKSVKYDWTMTTYPPSGWTLDNTTRKGSKDDKDIVFNFTAPINTAKNAKTCNMSFTVGPTTKTVKIVQQPASIK